MNSAWLVTWEAMGDHALAYIEEEIEAILNPRFSAKRVAEIVQFLYIQKTYTVWERLLFVKNKSNAPAIQYGSANGIVWRGRINCGDNPCLFARKVDNLRIEVSKDGETHPVWTEREPPTIGN
jgi:hypothetical protein